MHAFADAWNAGDATALAALFAEDADFVNVVGLWWSRREDIEAAHAYGFRRIFPGSSMRVVEVKVRPLGDVAVVHARWELSGQTAPDGSRGEGRRGVLVLVAQRGTQGWTAVTAQNTDRLPGSETLLVSGGHATPVSYRSAGPA